MIHDGIQIKLGIHVIGLFPITHAKQAVLYLSEMMENNLKITVMNNYNEGSLNSENLIQLYSIPIDKYTIHNWNCLMNRINKNNESEEETIITNRQIVDIIYAFNDILRKEVFLPNYLVRDFASIRIFHNVSKFIHDLDEDFPGIKYFNESNVTKIKISDLFIEGR